MAGAEKLESVMALKTKSKSSLGYIPGTGHCHLFNPGDKSIDDFETRHGPAMTIGSVCSAYPKNRIGIAGYWIVAFHRLVVRDRVDPHALHKALLQIPAYQKIMKLEGLA